MPPLPSPGPIIQSNILWKIEADLTALTRHFWRYTGGAPSSASLATMAALLVSAGSTRFASLCTTTVGMESATCIDLSSNTGAEGVGGVAWTGPTLITKLPPGAATVLSHEIPRRYRGGHPRSYFPIGDSSQINATGVWASTYTTAAQGAFNSWVADIVAGSGVGVNALVNVSYYSGFTVVINPVSHRAKNVSTPRAVPTIDVVSTTIARTNIGSQRRRNRKA